jgi:hypothetical protein
MTKTTTISLPWRAWTLEEADLVRGAYSSAATNEELRLLELSARIGRTVNAIYIKASKLGLGSSWRRKKASRKVEVKKFKTDAERRASSSRRMKEWIATNGHPRGALGMRHTEESKAKIAAKSREANARRTSQQLREYIHKGLMKKIKNGTYAPHRCGTTWKAGWREIGGVRKFYRSKWEANYAHYLQWQKVRGLISDWKHEPTTFWFKGVKRGCVSYLPDFWVQDNDAAESYHEIKGWMDARSLTKIKRMAKYHPTVRLVVIDGKRYEALRKSVSGIVDGWEP